MVRNLPITSRSYETSWETHEPMVEQYFPRQMSWYAPEGPQGRREELARLVKEQPLKAVGVAFLVGFALAMVGGPAVRVGAGVGGFMARRALRKRSACRGECCSD
jgi:hypothetical protein